MPNSVQDKQKKFIATFGPELSNELGINVEDVIHSEGYRDTVYKDTTGNKTVGVGFNMDKPGAREQWTEAGINVDFDTVYNGAAKLPDGEVAKLLHKTASYAQDSAREWIPEFDSLDANKKQILTEMVFQLGSTGARQFKNFKSKLLADDIPGAIASLKNSKWYRQTPARVNKHIELLQGTSGQQDNQENALLEGVFPTGDDGTMGLSQVFPVPREMATYREPVPPVNNAISVLASADIPENMDSVTYSEQLRTQDLNEQEINKLRTAKDYIANPAIDPDQSILLANKALGEPSLPKSYGQLFTKQSYPSLIGSEAGDKLSKAVDQQVTYDDYIQTLPILLDDGRTMDFTLDGSPFTLDKFLDAPFSELFRLVETTPTPLPFDELAMFARYQGTKALEDPTVRDVISYISMEPVDPTVEIDAYELMRIMWEEEDVDYAYNLWDHGMSAKYGDDYKLKMAAFMAKEIGVDAALLWVVGPTKFGQKFNLLGKTEGFKPFVKGLVARALVLGTGGGAAQAALNEAFDLQGALSPTDEIVTRAVGVLVGETALRAVGKSGELVGSTGSMMSALRKKFTGELVGPQVAKIADDDIAASMTMIQDPGLSITAKVATASGEPVNPAKDMQILSNIADEYAAQVNKPRIDAVTPGGGIPYAQPRDTSVNAITGLTNGTVDDLTTNMLMGASGYVPKLDVVTPDTITDALAMGQAVAFRTLGQATARQDGVDNLFAVSLDRQYRYRPRVDTTSREGISVLQRTLNVMRSPEEVYGPLAHDYTQAARNTAKIANDLHTGAKIAISGLDKKGQERLSTLLWEGDEAGKVFSPTELTRKGFSLQEQDAYFAMRKALDYGYMVLEDTMRNLAKENGWRTYEGALVKTAKSDKEGMTRISFLNKENKVMRTQEVPTSSLRDPDTIVNYTPGYIPHVYDAKYAVTRFDKKTGKLERIGAFNTKRESEQFVNSAQGKEAGVVFWHRWDDTEAILDFGANSKSIKALDTLSDTEREAFIAEVKKYGLEADSLEVIFDGFGMSGLGRLQNRVGRDLAGPDGKPLLMLPMDAIQSHFEYISSMAGKYQWRKYATDKFVERYRTVVNKGAKWDDPITMDGPIARQARMEQAWLKRVIKGKTKLEEVADRQAHQISRELFESDNAALKGIGGFLDNGRLPSQLARDLKTGTAYAKLLSWNLGMLIVQPFQGVYNLFAKDVSVVNAAVLDAGKLLTSAIKRSSGKRLSVEEAKLLQALDRSAYVADINSTDLVDAYSAGVPFYGHVPMQAGEMINKIAAWTTSRQELIRKVSKGELIGLDGKPFKGVVDDAEFLSLVNQRADSTAYNMSRSGQIEGLSGFGSTLFQFWQIVPKTAEMFYWGKGLSPREKLNAAVGLMAVGGWQAMPLLGDVIDGIDYTLWNSEDKSPAKRHVATQLITQSGDWLLEVSDPLLNEAGISRDTLKDIVTRGAIHTLSDGEVDIVNRVSMYRFLSEYMDNQSIADSIPFLAVMNDAIEAGGTIVDAWATYGEIGGVVDKMARGEPLPEDYEKTALIELILSHGQAMGQIFPMASNLTVATDNYFQLRDPGYMPDYKKYLYTKQGVKTDIPVTDGMLVQQLFGLRPGRVVEASKRSDNVYDIRKTYTAWEDDLVRRYKETRHGTPSARMVRQQEFINEVYRELSPDSPATSQIMYAINFGKEGKPQTTLPQEQSRIISRLNGVNLHEQQIRTTPQDVGTLGVQ